MRGKCTFKRSVCMGKGVFSLILSFRIVAGAVAKGACRGFIRSSSWKYLINRNSFVGIFLHFIRNIE